MPLIRKSRRGLRNLSRGLSRGRPGGESGDRGAGFDAPHKAQKSEKTHIFRYEVHGQSLSESSNPTDVEWH
jgi:hypothetical protein